MDRTSDLSTSTPGSERNENGNAVVVPTTANATATATSSLEALQIQDESVRKVPKLYHKKSRTGCQRCRARRVKCDEAQPVCQHCQRHRLPCVYDRPNRLGKSEGYNTASQGPGYAVGNKTPFDRSSPPVEASCSKNSNDVSLPMLQESKSRRMLELRLFHHYMTSTSLSMLGSTDPMIMDHWRIQIPSLAFENEALLSGIYAFTALHLAKTRDASSENLATYQKYLDAAIQAHRNDMQHLGPKNADHICQTSTFMRMAALSALQDRVLEPYTPPIQFLQTTSGARSVFEACWKYLAGNEESVTMQQLNRTRIISDISSFLHVIDKPELVNLLRREGTEASAEPWSREIEDAYAFAINYIGSARASLEKQEEASVVCRRLILFPMMVLPKFIELVSEMRPRALTVLAWYYGLLALFRGLWWMGDIGPREVRGIVGVLGEEWQDLLAWPLKAIKQEPVM